MSALSIIRGAVIGVAAVALPGVAYGVAVVSILRGAETFVGFVALSLAVAGTLAWTCVRFAHFSTLLAVVLTTIPFMVTTLLTVSALFSGAPAGFLIQAVILAAAVGVTWAATCLAKRMIRLRNSQASNPAL
jgi:hypothetical protein